MISWPYGNTLPLAVRLKEVTKTQSGLTEADYTPPEGSEVRVSAVGEFRKKDYDNFELNGNLLTFTDDGTLSIGSYGIVITVREPQSRNLRSFKCGQLQIVKCVDELELGEFISDGAVFLDAATYFWAKGDKGDKGDTGTTDYNALENKPDLSIYMQEITQEEFDNIFN